jgi:hypothetical protein
MNWRNYKFWISATTKSNILTISISSVNWNAFTSMPTKLHSTNNSIILRATLNCPQYPSLETKLRNSQDIE